MNKTRLCINKTNAVYISFFLILAIMDINVFYLIPIEGNLSWIWGVYRKLLLVIVAFMLFVWSKAWEHTTSFMKNYVVAMMTSLSIIVVTSVLRYDTNPLKYVLLEASYFLLIFLAFPIYRFMVRNGKNSFFSTLNIVAFIWYVICIMQVLIYSVTGNFFLYVDHLFRNDNLRFSLKSVGCVMVVYNFCKIWTERDKKIGFNLLQFCLGMYCVFFIQQTRAFFLAIGGAIVAVLLLYPTTVSKKARNQIQYAPIGYYDLNNPKLFLKKARINFKTLHDIKRCDVVIDITQGDSFSDIYGEERFFRLSNIKYVAEILQIPFILGPQTYGPFMKQKVEKFARKIINKANLVVSRDIKSAIYLKELCDKDIYVGTDLAFGLPYNDEYATSGKLKVGINPSGLLCNKKNEKTDLNTALSADYDQYVLELINCLKERNFDIYLIPHVGEDGVNSFSEIEGVNTHPEFSNPIEAKSFISSMDIFIGARMHATIAAFSSGVATIPTAYSRKFAGLYETLDYKYVVDLTRDNTSEALQQTMLYVDAYLELKKSSKYSMQKVKKIYDAMEDKIQKEMEKIVNNRRSK